MLSLRVQLLHCMESERIADIRDGCGYAFDLSSGFNAHDGAQTGVNSPVLLDADASRFEGLRNTAIHPWIEPVPAKVRAHVQ